jgi:hypothetical protein
VALPLKRWRRSGIAGVLGAQDVLILAAVVALPWFWGGIRIEAYRGAAAIIALAAGWALMRRGASGLGLNRGGMWLIPAFLLGAVAFAQTVPLPRAWVSRLSPKAAALQAEAFGPEGIDGAEWLRHIEADARSRVPEAANLVAGGDGVSSPVAGLPSPPRGFTLSLLRSATLERAYWYTALLLAFLVVHRRTVNPVRAAAYRATLFVSAVSLAAVGILNRVTAPTRLLWLRDNPAEIHSFGPFVNPSHFGGAMELVAPWLLGYGLSATFGPSRRDRRSPAGELALLGACVCAAAAVLAASKMAVATIGLAYAVLIAVAIAVGQGRKRIVLIAGTVVVALALSAIALAGPLRARLAEFAATQSGGVSASSRGFAWTAALRLSKDYPVIGSGFGALADVLHAYLPRGEGGYWGELHNDYLEVCVAGGAIAAVLVTWLAVAYVRRVWGVVRMDTASGRLLPTLGIVSGLAALAVHEFVDFNLQIPANALLFVVTAAMCVSPLARSAEGR